MARILTSVELGAAAESGKTYLSLQTRVRRDRPGTTVVVEASGSLEGFAEPSPAVQAGPPVVDGLYEMQTWLYPVAVEDNPSGRGFLRFKAGQP